MSKAARERGSLAILYMMVRTGNIARVRIVGHCSKKPNITKMGARLRLAYWRTSNGRTFSPLHYGLELFDDELATEHSHWAAKAELA